MELGLREQQISQNSSSKRTNGAGRWIEPINRKNCFYNVLTNAVDKLHFSFKHFFFTKSNSNVFVKMNVGSKK